LVSLEVPSPAHPAAIATVCLVVLAELSLVVWVEGVGTINELLLGVSDWSCVVLLSNSALESSVGSEGPAGTAATLILD